MVYSLVYIMIYTPDIYIGIYHDKYLTCLFLIYTQLSLS